jgi:3-oxoacyl-[acyl-carrier-protein] synthase II
VAARVLITGLGVVSPIGSGVDAYHRALLEAESRPKDHGIIDPAWMTVRHTYSVTDASLPLPRGSAPFAGRASQLAIAAARQAVEDAGLAGHRDAGSIVGVAIGNAMGLFPFEVAAALGSALDVGGPNIDVATACSAGLYSVSLAAELLRTGQADVMIVGGAEAISRVAMGCFNRLVAFDPEVCRPFDAGRKGTVMGEGAAVLVLESEDHARRRGWTRSYACVAGEGWSCDAHHATIPEPSGRHGVRAARKALEAAQLGAGDVDAVLVHGTGTEQNDLTESAMLEQMFGDRPEGIWVCAVKSKLGHGGGAAGAFQCLTGALVLKHGVLPPTANITQLDPRCRIRCPSDAPFRSAFRNVLMNSYAFGGNNISLILGASADG